MTPHLHFNRLYNEFMTFLKIYDDMLDVINDVIFEKYPYNDKYNKILNFSLAHITKMTVSIRNIKRKTLKHIKDRLNKKEIY